VQSFLSIGQKMSDTIARIPLILINDGACGLKGCLYVMLQDAQKI
jgi:hypothetical protein